MNDSSTRPAIQVRTLLGSAQVPLALRCLSSLARTSAEKIGFIIHEDGSLTSSDADKLREKLPVTSIVTRKEADDMVLPQLQKHPACLEYRKTSPLALKLLDIALMESSPLFFCDSDVLFLAPHTGLFHGILDDSVQAVFMQDYCDSYSLRPWSIWPLTDQRVVSRLNSGLFALAAGAFDLDFIDYFLGKNWSTAAFQRRPLWIEQTSWSALAARLDTQLYDPRQIAMACPTLKQAGPTPIAIHFVSSYRGMIKNYADAEAAPVSGLQPQVIRSSKASPSNVLKFMLSEAITQLDRRNA